MRTWFKVPLIIGGALVVTALGIDAADSLGGSRSTMLASIMNTASNQVPCSSEMVPVWFETGFICVDRFEASVALSCVHQEPTGVMYTEDNLRDDDCMPESVASTLPWRYVTRTQAEQLCARAGKQLITPAVWYQAALGTTDDTCNVAGDLARTGAFSLCTSGVGAHDVVGNVWEWVTGDIVAGGYASRTLPLSGYVDQVDAAGVPLRTSSSSNDLYGRDYSWTIATSTTAMMRGGFYGGRSDSGLYSVHAGVLSDFASGAVGFRCMQPVRTL
jgi:hypothetical protein